MSWPYSDDSVLFLPGVPSYAPPRVRRGIAEGHKVFKFWEGTLTAGGPPIFVALPLGHPQLSVASIALIRKLQRVYPTCALQVQAPDWLRPYMPPRVRAVESRARIQYYRQINLIKHNHFNPVMKQTQEWQQLVLTAAGYYDVPAPGAERTPDVGQHWHNPYKDDPNVDIAIIPGGFAAEATQPNLAEKLTRALRPEYKTELVDIGPDGIAPALERLARSRFVVSCGDSNAAYAAASLGIPCLVFVRVAGAVEYEKPEKPQGLRGGFKRPGWLFDNSRQYEPFANVDGAPIDPNANPDALAEQVVKFVKNNMKAAGGESVPAKETPKRRKRNRS